MLNLILSQTKESFTNDFASVPNEKKVTLFLFCFVFAFLRNGSDAEAKAEHRCSYQAVAGLDEGKYS